MEKIIFKNKVFEYALTALIMLLLSWNFFQTTIGNMKALIPIVIQGILLVLILLKNKNAKIAIKVWAVILILSHGLSLLAKLFKVYLGDEIYLTIILKEAVFLTIGILIYLSNYKYVEIVKNK